MSDETMSRQNFRAPKSLLEAGKEQAGLEGYPNFSEFVRDALREQVDPELVAKKAEQIKEAEDA